MMYGLQIQEFSTDTWATVTVMKRGWSYLECLEILEAYLKRSSCVVKERH